MNKTEEKPGSKGNKNKREIKMAAVLASRFALFKSRFLWRHLSYPLSASHPELRDDALREN